MVLLVTTPLPEIDLGPLAGRLRAAAPEMRSFVHVVSSRGADTIEHETVRTVAGAPFIEERLSGLTYRIYPQTLSLIHI